MADVVLVFFLVNVDALFPEIVGTDGEAQGNQQTAGHHKGQHVGHAGHQVLVETAEGAALTARFGRCPFALMHSGFGQGLLNKAGAVVNGRLGLTAE